MKNDESKEIKFKNNNPNKTGFFIRIKRSIFNVETYGEFLLEKMNVVIKYFLLLLLITSIALVSVSTYQFGKIVSKGYNYINNELPDFKYEKGMLQFANSAEGYDKDLDFYDIIATDKELTDSEKETYKERVKDYTYAVIFFQDEVSIFQDGQFFEYPYKDLDNEFNIDIRSKADLENIINSIGVSGVNITYFFAALISVYFVNFITYISDILLVATFGYIVAKIVRIPLNFSRTITLGIYSMTLSIILSTIYTIVYSLTGFVIEYFNIMYVLVAYVYIIAAILIIKSDLIKQQVELQKIYKVEKEVKQELEEQREEKKEQEEKDKKEKQKKKKEKEDDEPVINREPDGSEI